mgnify:CR=1 FL=1
MLQSDKVQSSAAGKIKLREAYREAGLTIKELAETANVGEDTVKRLLGTKECPNGVERWAAINIAKVLQIEPTDIVDPKDWYPQQLPPEFRSLIEEKIRHFCGRKFVFDKFDEFVNSNPNGYFTIVGDAGMGKSAIAAHYIASVRSCPGYFNILAEGRNRAELFLDSIRQQLINFYKLSDAEKADLPTLLAKVSHKFPDERIIIVIDALDEVEQEAGAENILYLPKTLPPNVYFLMTRRPYEPGRKRLFTEVLQRELNLNSSEYYDLNRADIKDYIRFFIYEESKHKQAMKKWIDNRQISAETFVEQVAQKSENNFMYLRYVLPEIACGFYDNLSLNQLPDGLIDYYQTHWVRMGMDTAPNELMVVVLFILKEVGTPIPCQMIADIANQDEGEVESILDRWIEYLKPQQIDGDTCYNFYHASFLDFLKAKKELNKNRKLFKDVNQSIVDYWERQMEQEDEDDAEDC